MVESLTELFRDIEKVLRRRKTAPSTAAATAVAAESGATSTPQRAGQEQQAAPAPGLRRASPEEVERLLSRLLVTAEAVAPAPLAPAPTAEGEARAGGGEKEAAQPSAQPQAALETPETVQSEQSLWREQRGAVHQAPMVHQQPAAEQPQLGVQHSQPQPRGELGESKPAAEAPTPAAEAPASQPAPQHRPEARAAGQPQPTAQPGRQGAPTEAGETRSHGEAVERELRPSTIPLTQFLRGRHPPPQSRRRGTQRIEEEAAHPQIEEAERPQVPRRRGLRHIERMLRYTEQQQQQAEEAETSPILPVPQSKLHSFIPSPAGALVRVMIAAEELPSSDRVLLQLEQGRHRMKISPLTQSEVKLLARLAEKAIEYYRWKPKLKKTSPLAYEYQLVSWLKELIREPEDVYELLEKHGIEKKKKRVKGSRLDKLLKIATPEEARALEELARMARAEQLLEALRREAYISILQPPVFFKTPYLKNWITLDVDKGEKMLTKLYKLVDNVLRDPDVIYAYARKLAAMTGQLEEFVNNPKTREKFIEYARRGLELLLKRKPVMLVPTYIPLPVAKVIFERAREELRQKLAEIEERIKQYMERHKYSSGETTLHRERQRIAEMLASLDKMLAEIEKQLQQSQSIAVPA